MTTPAHSHATEAQGGQLPNSAFRNEVVERVKLSMTITASEIARVLAERAWTVVHISFQNMGGVAFTVAASVANAGATVASSSATLAADTVAEAEAGNLANTAVADGAEIRLTAGDQLTCIVVTLERRVNA